MGAYVHPMSEEFEEMERIPWAALAASTPDPRRRLVAAGVGLVALIALLVVVGRPLLGSGATADSDLAVASQSSVAAVASDQSSLDPTIPEEPQAASAGNGVYSEADLMASSADDEVRIAEMWAERFVRDYLTVDDYGPAAIEAAQIMATDLPESPTGLTSFVEWVDAYAITAVQPARYRVEVAYRLLTGSEGAFVRQPAAALAVTVSLDADGTAIFAGIPEVVTIPELQWAAAPISAEQIPDWVLENPSIDSSSVVGAYRDGSDWRVIIMSELAPGLIRPHLVGGER